MPNWIRNVVQFYSKHEDAINALTDQLLTKDEERTNYKGEKVLKDNVFDFNNVVPMPEEIRNTESGSMSDAAIRYYLLSEYKRLPASFNLLAFEEYLAQNPFKRRFEFPDSVEKIDEMMNAIIEREGKSLSQYSNVPEDKVADKLYEIGCTHMGNILKYGVSDWYDWSCDKWGTKWNACHPELVEKDVLDYYENPEENNRHYANYEFDTAWSAPHPVIEAISRQNPEVSITHMWADEDFGYNCGMAQYDHTPKGGLSVTTYEPKGGTMPAYLLAATVREVSPNELLTMLPTKERTNLIEIFDVTKFGEF